MFTFTRAATAAVVAVALAALPVLLDRCEASCDMHRPAAEAPSCHHASPSAPRVGHAPAPCGHDHSGAVAASVVGATPSARASAPPAAEIADTAPHAHAIAIEFVSTSAPPGPIPALPPTRLPLRI